MIAAASSIEKQVKEFCALIGADPLLVQGAGGNVSWKDEGVLWVKASGTKLSDAHVKNIFVPVDLESLKEAISSDNFEFKPEVIGDSRLIPSIETYLHALIDCKYVIHLHAVEVLSVLVQDGCESLIKKKVGEDCIILEYHKPGPILAGEIKKAIANRDCNTIFLKNHGLVLGGGELNEVLSKLNSILRIFKKNIINKMACKIPSCLCGEYRPLESPFIHSLAVNKSLLKFVKSNWALYPDHVVFLGERAKVFENMEFFEGFCANAKVLPDIVFVENSGVFVTKNFNLTKEEQLQCYYEVLIRQDQHARLSSLSNEQINELVTWEAEKHRINMDST